MHEFYEKLIKPEADKLEEMLNCWDIPYLEIRDCAHPAASPMGDDLICNFCDMILENVKDNQRFFETEVTSREL